MRIKKAVIPAAGLGTRMLPITSAVPKELLPVCGRPVIEHVVNEAVKAGIEEIILVISKGKEAVAEYFKPNKGLESLLLSKGLHDELRELERIWNLVELTVVYQDEQLGLGHAVLTCKHAVGNEPFAVLLGDSIVHLDDHGSFTRKLVDAYAQFDHSAVGLQSVERGLIGRYGIFESSSVDNGIHRAGRVIEKPSLSDTESNLAFCARYVFKPSIFELLEQTEPGKNGEIQLTDAMQKLIAIDGLLGIELEGERYDIGDPKGLLLANLSLTDCGE